MKIQKGCTWKSFRFSKSGLDPEICTLNKTLQLI